MARTSLPVIALAIASHVMVDCGQTKNGGPTGPTASTNVASVTVTSGPMSGSTIQLAATARMMDGSMQDVTQSSTWNSSNSSVVSVSGGGTVTLLGSGTVDVSAIYRGVSGSTHLVVALPAVTSITLSGATSPGSFQLTATAHRADGSSQNITTIAAWQSSNPQIATISPSGFVTVAADGEVDLEASYQGATGSVHATVAVYRAFAVAGTVVDGSSPPIAIEDVRVQILNGVQAGLHAFTDSQGTFRIAGVPVGITLVEFTHDGYDTVEREIAIVDRDIQLSVVMTKASAATPMRR